MTNRAGFASRGASFVRKVPAASRAPAVQVVHEWASRSWGSIAHRPEATHTSLPISVDR